MKTLRKIFLWSACLLLAALAFMATQVDVVARQRLYKSISNYKALPSDFELRYTESKLSTKDGETLTLWNIEPLQEDASKPPILFFQGSRKNMSRCLAFFQKLSLAGFPIVAYDYRGYGSSTGEPSEKALIEDLHVLDTYLQDALGERYADRLVSSHSFGAAVGIAYASLFEPAGILVDSGFTSLLDASSLYQRKLSPFMRAVYSVIPFELLVKDKYDSQSRMAEVDCPKVFFYHELDEMNPISMGEALYEASEGPKRFIVTSQGHVGPKYEEYDFDAYLKAMETLIDMVERS